MKAVIQRVSKAKVTVEGQVTGSINTGLLILLGVEDVDGDTDVEWLAGKISRMRIFNDEEGKMNLSLTDVNGKILLVSQFTLHANTKKGNRPSFVRAAQPAKAEALYLKMKALLQNLTSTKVETGIFGAMMEVELVNDGPVTIIIDSREV